MLLVEVDVATGDQKEILLSAISTKKLFTDFRESSRHVVSSSFECVTMGNTLSPTSRSSTVSQTALSKGESRIAYGCCTLASFTPHPTIPARLS